MSPRRITGFAPPRYVVEGEGAELVSNVLGVLVTKEGGELVRQLLTGDDRLVRIGPTLVAQLTAASPRTWTITRTDTMLTLAITADEIDELTRVAWQFRHAHEQASYPLGAHLAEGRFEVTERLRGTLDRGQLLGRDRETDERVIITVAGLQRVEPSELERSFALSTPGVARLLHIGPLDATYHALVESLPAGTPANPPMELEAALRVALAVARISLAAHERGDILRGLRPELVFIDGDVVTVAPRCEPFIETAKPPSYGVPPCFSSFYLAPEVLALRPVTARADVFSVTAMLAHWLTGEHPFQGAGGLQAMAISTGARRELEIPERFRSIIDRGLAPVDERIDMATLVALLTGP